ncbi:MAG: hypothetical protein G01um10145_587 [Microgenomates group bacterium Gr01-1014_5]|nr:MAG: hypothetical protein G01um10145_587 [Microgenomates group bacterium Gr01-1014_5]
MLNFDLVKVFFITLFFSFGVQALFYLRYAFGNRKIIREHKAVIAYKSGVIGDGVLIPLTNVFAWLVLGQLAPWNTQLNFFLTTGATGLLITFLFHWGQQRFHLTNWTMPTSGHWTLLGVYHAIFMFCEISFLSFVLFNYLFSVFDGTRTGGVPLSYALIILFLFFVTFVHDYWRTLFSKFVAK